MSDSTISKGLKGIIFDCDGVMIDSEEANRFFYNSVLSWLGLPPMSKSQEQYAFMATALDALNRMVPEHLKERIPEAITNGIDYHRDVLPRVTLMPGFLDFIKKAHARSLLLAIDSNRTAEGIQRVLDFFNLPNYFDPVVSSTTVPPKPSPEGVRLICNKWNALPEQVLFIGDSENDQKTAQNAGTRFIAFGGAGSASVTRVQSYQELSHLLWPNFSNPHLEKK